MISSHQFPNRAKGADIQLNTCFASRDLSNHCALNFGSGSEGCSEAKGHDRDAKQLCEKLPNGTEARQLAKPSWGCRSRCRRLGQWRRLQCSCPHRGDGQGEAARYRRPTALLIRVVRVRERPAEPWHDQNCCAWFSSLVRRRGTSKHQGRIITRWAAREAWGQNWLPCCLPWVPAGR